MAPKIDYTARDFDTIMVSLKAHLQAKFPATWKNFYESGIGTQWLELVAYVGDMLSFYLDYAANENFLPTARDRASVINLGKLVGYQLRPPTSAAVSCTATITAIHGTDVVIPADTVITLASGLVFRTLTAQRIEAGSLTAEIDFTEGEARSDAFVSTGVAWQSIRVSEPGAVYGSIVVTVDGTTWDRTSSLVYSSALSAEYSTVYNEDDYAYIKFGDGVNGQVPPTGAAITVSYRVGGGIASNILINEINTTVVGNLEGTLPIVPITVSVANNLYRGSGGEDRETIEHAKLWIPRWVSANGRAVTENDFDALANAFSDSTYGAPSFVKAKLKQEIPELNTVQLYVWGRDSMGQVAAASVGLKDAIYAYFSNNGPGSVRTICTDVEMQDGEITYIDVVATVTVSSAYSATAIVATIESNLDALFSSAGNIPGTDVHLSKIYNAMQDVEGVEHAIIDSVTASDETIETIGAGNGVTTSFAATLDIEANLSIIAGSVEVVAGSLTLSDNGSGSLSGNGTGTINYATGTISITFSSAPPALTLINVTYRHILDYARNELLQTTTGSNDFTGVLSYPPAVAYDIILGQKGIAISDGSQVILDFDGDGILKTTDGTICGTIDYDTGAYDFSFPVTPSSGLSIWAAYYQKLQTASEDIPIDKEQLAVKGTYTITTTTA